ncbi:family 16 glycosylhydrolase [Flavobacterium sp.]|jgi:beta-glucanase (GH16 family)|uniref:family 16 glycosylhydrolase n=1 Tax=Flavobacterium sp. TaxID=239 RepID=UPI0037C197E3
MSTSKIAHLISIFFLGINFSFSQVDVVYSDLVWSDEFNTNGAVDPAKWHHQTQLPAGGGWFNGEVQHYTNELANSFVNNGALHIVAIRQPYTSQGFTKQFTSARLNSKFAFTYGRVDVRAKLPIQQGTWPAIWMLGKNVNEDGGFFDANFGTTSWPACGEIDIMEHGITPSRPINYVQSALHTPSSFGNTVNHGGTLAANLGTDFHVYSMNWSPFQITFLLDGVAFYSYNPAVKTPSNWPFNLDQYLLLNIAMGGVAGTINSNFSQDTMVIDYVRVYQNVQADTQIPANFTATLGTITSSSIELLLNGTDNSGSLVYGVTYGTNSTTTAGNSGVQKSVVISGLSPNTNYSFSVSASDLSGNNAANNAIVLSATTTGVTGCSGTSNLAQQGSFSTGYNYAFETLGTNSVKITYELLDTDKVGLVAYLWRQSPFTETQMTNVSGRIFTHTLTGQTPGATLNYGVKFAYANGMSVTPYYQYVVGNNCNLNSDQFSNDKSILMQNPARDVILFDQNTTIQNVKIYSLLGQLMLDADQPQSSLDISSLSSGVYFVLIQSDQKIHKEKLIIE